MLLIYVWIKIWHSGILHLKILGWIVRPLSDRDISNWRQITALESGWKYFVGQGAPVKLLLSDYWKAHREMDRKQAIHASVWFQYVFLNLKKLRGHQVFAWKATWGNIGEQTPSGSPQCQYQPFRVAFTEPEAGLKDVMEYVCEEAAGQI